MTGEDNDADDRESVEDVSLDSNLQDVTAQDEEYHHDEPPLLPAESASRKKAWVLGFIATAVALVLGYLIANKLWPKASESQVDLEEIEVEVTPGQ